MNTALATLCVLLFSLTMPATRMAALSFPPEMVALLRLLGAGLVCAITVGFVDRWVPPRKAWLPLAATALASVAGFSILGALAMKRVPATHGAVGLATLPALTALYASVRDRVNPGLRFWLSGLAGTVLTIGYFAAQSHAGLGTGDALLVAGVAVSAFGYVEGGRLSRIHGGRHVMSWAVLLTFPFSLAVAIAVLAGWLPWTLPAISAAPGAWLSALYLATVSQSLGMFVWFRVLARGPMAQVAMLQLIQPFFSLLAAMFFLGENPGSGAWFVAAAVAVCVFSTNRARAASDSTAPKKSRQRPAVKARDAVQPETRALETDLEPRNLREGESRNEQTPTGTQRALERRSQLAKRALQNIGHDQLKRPS